VEFKLQDTAAVCPPALGHGSDHRLIARWPNSP
jgi:hypothetical protein